MAQRLFFALWPDEAFCDDLLQRSQFWLSKTNGRAVAQENLHVTLAFLGNVDDTQQACLEQVAAATGAEAFRLSLNHLAMWPQPRVVWAGASEAPAAFVELAKALQQGARGCGLSIESRPPVAHLTLKRKVSKAPVGEDFEPLNWDVQRFYLVASKTFSEGVVYERLRSWSLR